MRQCRHCGRSTLAPLAQGLEPGTPFSLNIVALAIYLRVVHSISYLPEIRLLMLCATIAGADDFVAVALWGSEHLDFLRRFLPYQRDIPSHDVLCDVIAAIDPEAFRARFLAWVATLRAKDPAIIAIDGKTSRRSHARSKDRLPLHTTGQRLVLGQETVAAKANEIVAIPALLRAWTCWTRWSPSAMGTQTAIAQTIRNGGGDYAGAQGELAGHLCQVEAVFATPPDGLSIQRSHAIGHDVGWLFSERRYPGEFRFPGLAAIGMVENETERNGLIEQEKRYSLCSRPLDVDSFARIVHGH